MTKIRNYLTKWPLSTLATLLTGVGLLQDTSVAAQSDLVWTVTGRLLGAGGDEAENVSGIACAAARGFPRSCLLIDDEMQAAQIVIVKDGEIIAGDAVPLISDTHRDKLLELDGEGVAYDNGFYYVVGSHGHPRDKKRRLDSIEDASVIAARIKASSQVARVRIDLGAVTTKGKLTAAPDVMCSAKLSEVFASRPELKPFLNKRLDENGLTVEGLAVREDRLYVGFRGPMLKGNQTAVLSVSLGAVFEDKEVDAELHLLSLGANRGVRDLVAFDTGFLILAGPSADQDGIYSIYYWDGHESTKLLKDLPEYVGKKGKQQKAEAILPLDQRDDGLSILVLFDGPKQGVPRSIGINYP